MKAKTVFKAELEFEVSKDLAPAVEKLVRKVIGTMQDRLRAMPTRAEAVECLAMAYRSNIATAAVGFRAVCGVDKTWVRLMKDTEEVARIKGIGHPDWE